MTLDEGKRKVYELLDEYTSGGQIAIDTDIEKKLPDLFDIAQKKIAQLQKIVRLTEVERVEDTEEYALPDDCMRLWRVWYDGEVRNGLFRMKGTKIVIPAAYTAAVELEYFAYPATIGPATEDSYEFEVREDGAQAMPFFVAGMVLSSDLVQDPNIYLTMWQMMLQDLDTELPGMGNAPMRNRFFRR